MQAISGSVGLSLNSTDTSITTGLGSELGGDMASGLGFLAMFATQVNPATANLDLAALVKGQLQGGEPSGNLFPQGLPQNLPQGAILSELLPAGGLDQIMDSKLLTNINNEAKNLLESLGTTDTEDSRFSQLQELASSALRSKSEQVSSMRFGAITSQLGSQSWGDELATRVKWQIGQEIQEAKLSLNPRELGPLQVKINIIDDQAHVQFMALHGSVRDAVEDALPRLREMLEEAGVVLADADVSQQSPEQNQGFFAEAESTKDQFVENINDDDELEQTVKVIRAGVGLVDAFV